jgi:inorganic pyrophosphatase
MTVSYPTWGGVGRSNWFERRKGPTKSDYLELPYHRGDRFGTVRSMGELVVMVVEIPRGSSNKYEVDPDSGDIYLDRTLFTATHYPAEYGFVPDTLAGDGDPIDILCLTSEPTFPGCRIRVRPVAVLRLEDQGEIDDKIISVPAGDPRHESTQDLSDLAELFRKELEHFFLVYSELEKEVVTSFGWQGREAAWGLIEDARHKFVAKD